MDEVIWVLPMVQQRQILHGMHAVAEEGTQVQLHTQPEA